MTGDGGDLTGLDSRRAWLDQVLGWMWECKERASLRMMPRLLASPNENMKGGQVVWRELELKTKRFVPPQLSLLHLE